MKDKTKARERLSEVNEEIIQRGANIAKEIHRRFGIHIHVAWNSESEVVKVNWISKDGKEMNFMDTPIGACTQLMRLTDIALQVSEVSTAFMEEVVVSGKKQIAEYQREMERKDKRIKELEDQLDHTVNHLRELEEEL